MKLKIKTDQLKQLVSKSVRGASNNKMIPITGLMAIELKDKHLTLTTTDASNTLKVTANEIEGEDGYIVIQTETFSRLIARLSTEITELTLKGDSLEVKSNGTYNIEIPLDEEGNQIIFPQTSIEGKTEEYKIKMAEIRKILTINKAALANTMEQPCLTGYYIGESIITTNTFKVCSTNTKLIDSNVLITPEMMDLLDLVEDLEVKMEYSGNKIRFTSSNIEIYGTELEGKEDYPVEAVEGFIGSEFNSSCTIPKEDIMKLLDRLSLFVSPYDKNGVYLTFQEAGIMITNKRNNGVETIKYIETNNFVAYTGCIDIELFKTQIEAQSGDKVNLFYGHDIAIKMVDGKTTQIVALLEDDRGSEVNE